MKRFAAQYLVQDAENWLRNRVIEQNDDLSLTAIYNLSEMQTETAHTLFYDGIITQFPLQFPSEVMPDKNINILLQSLREKHHSPALEGLTLSLLSDRLNAITRELRLLSGSDLPQIFNQCIFNSIAPTSHKAQIAVGEYPVLVLWQYLDLKELKLTSNLQIKLISPAY